MMFSILLSVYKNEKDIHLNEALLSIWDDQTLKPSEIVIVEDGPLTLELYQLLDTWTIKLPNVLKRVALAKNVGLGEALNRGLKHCSNEWVFRMDSDDICMPNRFEKQVKYIQNHPEIGILSGQILEFDGFLDNVTGTRSVPLTHDEILRYSKFRSPFNHVAIAFKKSIIESVGGYQHHLFMEDYNLWIRVLASGVRTANIQDNLVLVRAGDAMVARRRGKEYLKSEWQLFELKNKLDFQPKLVSFLVFLMRSTPRMLPNKVLVKIYSRLR